jgi:peptidoglycan/LPS O-acetylase OafA/YrhL
MLFRNNINSLRAVAVLIVVLYHFGVPGFSGGFVGVDVFFVISGFLMTGILCTALQRNEFSLWKFYASRARRIVPALAVLCAALVIFGFFFLPLGSYRDLIKDIKHSLLFTSNIEYAQSGNYFSDSSQSNWLLHTWSLSVEWQFYLLYPLVLWLANKLFGARGLAWAVLGLAGCSLLASALMTPRDVTWAFYYLPTRAWEMLAGGLLWLFPRTLSTRSGQWAEVAGLAAIVAAIALFDGQDPWPGYSALLPVGGTLLVILANGDSPFSRQSVLQWLGRISYSVYLWHWPLVVGLYLSGLLGSPTAVAAGVGCAVILGALSYRLVESSRQRREAAKRALVRQLVHVLGVMLFAVGLGALAKSYPQLRPDEPQQPAYASRFYAQKCTSLTTKAKDCVLGQGEVKVILFGDSHAEATAAAVQLNNPGAALQWSYPGCPALARFSMRDRPLQRACVSFNRDKLAQLATAYPGTPVVLLSRAGLYTDPDRENSHYVSFAQAHNDADNAQGYIDEYADTVCQIAQHHPLYLVKPIPDMPFSVYKSLWFQHRVGRQAADIEVPISGYLQRNRVALLAIERAHEQCGAVVLDPTPLLCPEGRCAGSRNGVSLYWDDNHLVDAGNQLLAPLFKPLFP